MGSLQPGSYDDGNLEFLQQVARQIAVAVDNVLNYQCVQASQRDLAHEREELARERDRLRLLLEVNNAVVSNLNLRDLLMAISASLRHVIPHDFAGLALYNPALGQLHADVFDFPQHQDFIEVGIPIPLEGTPSGQAFTSRRTVLVRRFDPIEFPAEVMKRGAREGLKSICSVPLISHDRVLGTLDVASLREAAFSEQDADLLGQISNQFAIAVENALAYQQIADLKDKLN